MEAARNAGASVVKSTVLRQGKTLRWCVAWSYFPHTAFDFRELKAIESFGFVDDGNLQSNSNQCGSSSTFIAAAGNTMPAGPGGACIRSIPLGSISVKTALERFVHLVQVATKFSFMDHESISRQASRIQRLVSAALDKNCQRMGQQSDEKLPQSIPDRSVHTIDFEVQEIAKPIQSSDSPHGLRTPAQPLPLLACRIEIGPKTDPSAAGAESGPIQPGYDMRVVNCTKTTGMPLELRTTLRKCFTHVVDRIKRDILRTSKAWKRRRVSQSAIPSSPSNSAECNDEEREASLDGGLQSDCRIGLKRSALESGMQRD